MLPDADYTENGQLNGDLTEQDELVCSESSSLSDFDLDHSESIPMSGDFFPSIENTECSEYNMESNVSDQTVTEEHEPEAFSLFQAMPDLCMYYDQEDSEIQEPVLSDLEVLYEIETESEHPSEEDSCDEGSEEISFSAVYEQCSEQEPNAVFELDEEPCRFFEPCEPNNQNMPCECHTTHFESSELSQASKESMPAGISGSLVQQPPAHLTEDTYDSELTAEHSQESCTDSFENSVQSQLCEDYAEQTSEQDQDFEYYTEHDYEIECVEMLVQCSSCGKYFEKCEKQCESSEPAQNSEDSQQSESFETSPGLCETFETKCSVFHTSELPGENHLRECNTNEIRQRTERDMMFIRSMETFEARWLSQFLAVDCHQNKTFEKQEVEDLDVAVSEASNELLRCDSNAGAEPVIESPDNSSEQGMLCGECEMRENAQIKYGMLSEPFEPCGGTFDFDYVECRTVESVVKEASIDECSEEEYVDCIDSKSQGSTETDESFKSFIDEPEEICPVQTEDDRLFHELAEQDECCARHRQVSHEVLDGLDDIPDPYTHDGVEAHEETQEFCSEPGTLGKGLYKTYAEVLCSGLYTEPVQSPKPCLEHAVFTDEEEYGLKRDDEDTNAHVMEDQQDPEGFSEDEKVVESHEELILLGPTETAGEIYGLPSADESIYKGDTSDTCSIQSACHEKGISALEMYAEDASCTVNEVFKKFTEVARTVEKEVQHELVSETEPERNESANKKEACWSNLTDDAQIKEQNGVEVIEETEGECGTCGKQEKGNFVFAHEELVGDGEKYSELNTSGDRQNGDRDLLIVQNAIELQSDKDLLKDPEFPVCSGISLDPTETAQRQDDSPPQNNCSKNLDEIIHQVERSETTEQGETSDSFFKIATENTASEETEASEDTETSDDEDYPESCDCEFCVQSIEQVQCCRVPCATVSQVERNLFVACIFQNRKACVVITDVATAWGLPAAWCDERGL